ncbi:uncharacterized protein N7511_004451 [Penicillium nucicola]|uniref:uncharacterized protein n=1 Tax=Penicillium nucicola TaxID=1850975 RepID=UPI002545331A|nr:uncharacterized protein N7511_004451 [Penicillium nucicola]KAJ5766835.1 hypothetical protein N7511_004451 [Penicillium nucicola]
MLSTSHDDEELVLQPTPSRMPSQMPSQPSSQLSSRMPWQQPHRPGSMTSSGGYLGSDLRYALHPSQSGIHSEGTGQTSAEGTQGWSTPNDPDPGAIQMDNSLLDDISERYAPGEGGIPQCVEVPGLEIDPSQPSDATLSTIQSRAMLGAPDSSDAMPLAPLSIQQAMRQVMISVNQVSRNDYTSDPVSQGNRDLQVLYSYLNNNGMPPPPSQSNVSSQRRDNDDRHSVISLLMRSINTNGAAIIVITKLSDRIEQMITSGFTRTIRIYIMYLRLDTISQSLYTALVVPEIHLTRGKFSGSTSRTTPLFLVPPPALQPKVVQAVAIHMGEGTVEMQMALAMDLLQLAQATTSHSNLKPGVTSILVHTPIEIPRGLKMAVIGDTRPGIASQALITTTRAIPWRFHIFHRDPY